MQHLRLTLNRHFSLMVILILSLTACGFQLRGTADLSFKNIHIQGNKLSISRDLARSLQTNGIKIVENTNDAELFLELLGESNQKRILSLSGGGLVREFELHYQVTFRTRAPSNTIWSPAQTVQSQRSFSYNDDALLGKAEEEARLNADMRNDAIREIMRRLSAVKSASK